MDPRNFYRPGRAGCVASLVLLGGVLLLVAVMLNGCGQPQAIEPALVPPGGSTPGGLAMAPTAHTLPTAAATLPPPPSPSPLSTTDPAGAIMATQTAAVSPPTPAVTLLAVPASPTPELLPTPSGIYSWTLKVPILMYHYISTPPDDADVYRLDLSVTPEMFRQQMTWLHDNGYEAIDYYDLTRAIVGHAELPEKPVLLTFDDGYLDNYENAFPILQEYGFRGTFFIVTEFIDSGREGYMTWPMIEEMSRAGQRIESHSRTHPDLRDKDRDGLIWEILGAQETLTAHIGYRPRYFCFPGGDYNETVIAILQELDYWGAATTANDTWHGFNERFEWGRLRIRNNTTLQEFANVLNLEGTIRGKPPQ